MRLKSFFICTIISILLSLLLASCNKEHVYVLDGVDFDPKEIIAPYEGGSYDVKLESNGAIELVDYTSDFDMVEYKNITGNVQETDWFKVELGRDVLHITVSRNESAKTRHSYVFLQIAGEPGTMSFMTLTQLGETSAVVTP